MSLISILSFSQRLRRGAALGALLCLFFLAVSSSHAAVSKEDVEAQLARLETNDEFSDATRTNLTQQFESALNFLNLAEDYRQQAAEYQEAIEALPAKTMETRSEFKRIQRRSSRALLTEIEGLTLPQLEQRLIEEEAERSRLLNTIAELESALLGLQGRPDEIRADRDDLADRSAELTANLSASKVTGTETPTLTLANQMAQQAEAQAIKQHLQALELELLSSQVRSEHMRARLEFNELMARRATVRKQQIENLIADRRLLQAQASENLSEAQQVAAADKHPLIENIAAANLRLSKEVTHYSRKLGEVEKNAAEVLKRSLEVAEDYRSTQQKIEVAGLSQALGQVLLEERRSLPNPAIFASQSRRSETEISTVGLRQIQHEEERRKLSDIDAFIEDYTRELSEQRRQMLEPEILNLTETRLNLLDQAIDTEQAYLRALGELDFSSRQFFTQVESYHEYLSEHLLWIRSAPAFGLDSAQQIDNQLNELLNYAQYRLLLEDFLVSLKRHWWYLMFAVLALALIIRRRYLYDLLYETHPPLRRLTTDSIRHTLKGILYSLLIVAPGPLVLMTLAQLLKLSPNQSDIGLALSPSLNTIAELLFYLQFLRILSLPEGVGAIHFKWPSDSAKRLRADISRLEFIFLPAAFVASFLVSYDFRSNNGGLAQISLAISMIALAYCVFTAVKYPIGIIGIFRARRNTQLSGFTHTLIKTIALVFPLVMAGMSLLGYLYTAGTLSLRAIQTLAFIGGLSLLHQYIVRWLVLTQRKIAYQDALERRAAARAKLEEDKQTEGLPGEMVAEVEEPKVDFAALSKGAQELLATLLILVGAIGVWLIWAEVLPALNILDQVSVWQYSEQVGEDERLVPVTLADLAFAIIVVVGTLLATRRFPELLEFVLLQRLNLSAGGHYAVRTLTGYAVAAIGILFSLNIIGASWSQIQWLAAALSVGIGFGLQEIVANFISGLIILFERPIRVGDVVTVGDTDGVVTRIKIRATTIRNWEQKELLVPNKEFITSRLLNWSLSDSTTRLLIPVGIAYGSDVKDAIRILENILERNEDILRDPAPLVTFESFGDNALILYVRAFIGSLEKRLPTTTDLHVAIYQEFQDAGIEIAFPQRDIHLHTSKPLEMKWASDEERN